MIEENVLTALSDALVQAAERAGNSTVMVEARRRGAASGVVYEPDLILTANHVVEREREIRVGMPDGSTFPVQIAGRDPGSDLCLLRLNQPVGLAAPPAEKEAQVGQIILALGRPGAEGIQASLGVVGAVGGPLQTNQGLLERFIRTDAIPYPGFSGGPLVDGDGHVLGINTSGFAPGASLAIPATQAWRTARSLAQYGRVRRGFLGIRSESVELPRGSESLLGRSQGNGLLLVGVERGQPADQAGWMVGDILVGLNGQPVENHDTLMERLTGDLVGHDLPAEILRGGRLLRQSVKVGERR